MTSWGNGPLGSTAIVQCSGLIGMTNLSDYSCEDTYDPLLPVPNSNDPYVYVDKWTDRIMKFDMHALLGMTVEWSDNEGPLGRHLLWLRTFALSKIIKRLLLPPILQLCTQQLGCSASMEMPLTRYAPRVLMVEILGLLRYLVHLLIVKVEV